VLQKRRYWLRQAFSRIYWEFVRAFYDRLAFWDIDVDCLLPMAKSEYQNRIELLQGTLDMLILKTLQWGEQHGYGISQAIRVNSAEVLQWGGCGLGAVLCHRCCMG
jgi:hypothetical protein